jgi:ABC-type sugar transport system ATPase subunit
VGKVVLQMTNIHKSFPGVHALDSVNLEVREGEVHALLGENGAGKSTLIKVLGAIYKPDEGDIYINGEQVKMNNVRDAQHYGISIIHQELLLIPEMTIADNIFIGEKPKNYGFTSGKRIEAKAQKLLDQLNIGLDSRALVSSLSVAQQQIVEIVKAISFNAKLIVMDEPTSSLSQNEVNMLFGIIKQLKAEGVSIIYISHKLNELFEISDRITVMRDGKTVDTVNTSEVNDELLIKMMVGRELTDYYKRTEFEKGEVILSVQNLQKKNVFHDINFDLKKGEILGFAGLVGAGRTELMHAIFGADPYDQGEIFLNNKRIKIRSPKDAIESGIVLVPESRKEHGLILKNSVGFNMSLIVLKEFIKGISINKRKENEIMNYYKESLNIKTPSYDQIVSNLSGGNQQKVVLSKWLAAQPIILILDEPTRGIDVGAKSELYAIMNELSLNGMSIIMVSSEMQEVIAMSDRICVMNTGTIKTILDKRDCSQEKILAYAVGGD